MLLPVGWLEWDFRWEWCFEELTVRGPKLKGELGQCFFKTILGCYRNELKDGVFGREERDDGAGGDREDGEAEEDGEDAEEDEEEKEEEEEETRDGNAGKLPGR
ncbi:hypothetical protein WAI453_012808 [Rhynchosporium graminicola]